MSYTFTPSAISDPAIVKQLELDLAAIKPVRPRRKQQRSYERYGLANLCLPGNEPYTGNHPYVVRIYYKSMGGEVICVDSDPLSLKKAQTLYREHHRDKYGHGPSDAVGALLLPMENGKAVKTTVTKGCHEPRLVTLPSQMEDATEISHNLAVAA